MSSSVNKVFLGAICRALLKPEREKEPNSELRLFDAVSYPLSVANADRSVCMLFMLSKRPPSVRTVEARYYCLSSYAFL
jgi:hypothetical protein